MTSDEKPTTSDDETLLRFLHETMADPASPAPPEIEAQYAEMVAVYLRIKVSGVKHDAAVKQTAEYFRLESVDPVERAIEFRSESKPDECSWGGCERAPFSQGMCMKHYQQQRRAREKTG